MAKNFIAGAIKHPGAFTKQAEAAGKGVQEFAQEHKHDSGKTGARARLAITLGKISHKNKGKKKSAAHSLYPDHK